MKAYINSHELDRDDVLFYTYWFHITTVALGRILKNTKLVSRAHRFDLYDEELPSPHSSWKCLGVRIGCLSLFLFPKDGYHYLSENYPGYKEKV
ncbi:MAG: hypothetical protein U5K72_14550 [Balneolaceae bacterium]|nr:hypothetical protein [Balneolaceae bacterium]